MTELFIGALAAFFLWTCLRFILPFKLPDILALLAYGGIAYGVLCIPVHRVTLALACGGVVVFLHLFVTLLGATPSPWTPEIRLPVRRRATTRVPGEAPSPVGRRIPRL